MDRAAPDHGGMVAAVPGAPMIHAIIDQIEGVGSTRAHHELRRGVGGRGEATDMADHERRHDGLGMATAAPMKTWTFWRVSPCAGQDGKRMSKHR